MPPAGIRWCCTWEAVLLACCIWLALFLLTRGGSLPLVQRGAPLLASVLALPAAVVLLARGRVEIKAGLAGQPHPPGQLAAAGRAGATVGTPVLVMRA